MPPSTLETFAVAKFVDALLTGDATLAASIGTRFYFDDVPQDVTYPHGFGVVVGGADNGVMDGTRTTTEVFADLVLIGTGQDITSLAAAARQMDALLQGATGTQDGWEIASVRRQSAIQEAETDGSARYNRVGGNYRFVLRPAAE